MTDIQYKAAQCFNFNSKKCSEAERNAATLDYVGATRGEIGKVKFDGKLSEEEKQYVTTKFGAIEETSPEYLPVYLDNADKIFLADLLQKLQTAKSPEVSRYANAPCGIEEKWTVKHYKNKSLGEGTVLGGAHRCFQKYMQFYRERVGEFKVLQRPQDYYFFIESLEYGIDPNNREASQLALTAETQLFQRIAAALNIPASEATPFDTFHPQTIEQASQDSGRPKTDYYLTHLLDNFGSFLGIYTQTRSQGRDFSSNDWKRLWLICLDATKQKFNLSETEEKALIQALYVFFNQALPQDFSRDKVAFSFDDLPISTFIKDRTRELYLSSNQLSIPALQNKISESKKRQAIFVVGFYHVEMAADVYLPPKAPVTLPLLEASLLLYAASSGTNLYLGIWIPIFVYSAFKAASR